MVQNERQPKRASFAKYWKTRNQKQESEISKDDKKCQKQDQFQNFNTLSVDPEQSGLAGIPLLLLKDI